LYLLILESIGMQELILIGSIALIVFGPRKLPGMAKTVGKAMNEFKKATNEFKETWEKEAGVENETPKAQINQILENPVAMEDTYNREISITPEVKQISEADFAAAKNAEAEETSPTTNKKDWF
jgi:sec-independent protein translocase protein TatA